MSDTKRLKICKILENASGVEVKLLMHKMPVKLICGFGRLEKRDFDCANGAFCFKEIEWIFVPIFKR